MKVYAESSAPLAWLLEQEHAELVIAALEQADLVVASDLTMIECDRVMIRAVALGELDEADAAERQARLGEAAAHWTLLAIDQDVIERARRPFPLEPLRTLDAIHLAGALAARRAVSDLVMLSLDDRIRQVAARLGLPLVPTDAQLTR